MKAVPRSVTLPGPIESDAVEANYEHGVLTLTLPKSRASLPRRIPVNLGRAGGGQPRLEGQAPGAGQAQGQGQAYWQEGGLVDQASARDPSLEQQTPGLDEQQAEQTRRDAEAYFGQLGEAQGQARGQGQPGGQGGQGGQGAPRPGRGSKHATAARSAVPRR